MKLQKIFLITLLTALPATFVTATYADTGQYPPKDLFSPNKFPVQPSIQNSWKKAPAPSVMPRNFAPQRPVVPAAPRMPQQNYANNPYYSRNYAPRSAPGYAPNYGSRYTPRYTPYPQQQNNRYRSYQGNRGNMPFNNFGNNNNGFPFSGGNMPFMNNGNNSSMNPFGNMFGSNNNGSNKMPFFGNTRNKNRKKAWGEERHIWPDFYTDFTDDAWDSASSGPRDLGVMPGGWRFPHISTPDPVTVSDAITNQFPPIAEEAGNMLDISEWGVFDDK